MAQLEKHNARIESYNLQKEAGLVDLDQQDLRNQQILGDYRRRIIRVRFGGNRNSGTDHFVAVESGRYRLGAWQ